MTSRTTSKDLMERKVLVLGDFGTVVLDEADRMLDMGFIADMKMIMAKMLILLGMQQ